MRSRKTFFPRVWHFSPHIRGIASRPSTLAVSSSCRSLQRSRIPSLEFLSSYPTTETSLNDLRRQSHDIGRGVTGVETIIRSEQSLKIQMATNTGGRRDLFKEHVLALFSLLFFAASLHMPQLSKLTQFALSFLPLLSTAPSNIHDYLTQ
jgi:hypothetical protein